MSTTDNRLLLVDVEPWAETVLKKLLRGTRGIAPCIDGEIVGSIRRRRPDVGDVEIVLLPVYDDAEAATVEAPQLVTNLFDELVEAPIKARKVDRSCTLLDETLNDLMEQGIISRGNAWGSKLRRCIPGPYPGHSLEIYLATEQNYGNIQMIRTGSAAFSKAMASSWSEKGVLPADMMHEDGFLWRIDPGTGLKVEVIACRTERDYFAAVGAPYVLPEERYEAIVPKMRARIKATRAQAFSGAAS